jgi:hypothetical protein
MKLIACNFCSALALSLLAVAPASAQLGDVIPSASYYVAVEAFYSGEYRDAERGLRRETQRGVRAGQARWIDAICYHAMLGEVLYHEGRNAESLAEFDQACQLLLAYPNFLLQVRFQNTATGIRPDPNRARRIAPWGQSSRQTMFGLFSDTEQVLVGEFNAENVIRQGGVLRQPMFWRVDVIEVLRMSALAIRRRGELLGPLARHDAITKELSDEFSRGNLAPANHWSGAWIDLLRGLTQAGIGKFDEANMLLERSLLAEGRFDHPLTCIALLEQGRIAMIQGDSNRAGRLLAEAGFSAYAFENWDVLTESARLGWLNHLASGAGGPYPPLDAVATFGQVNRFQHIAVTLRLAQAETLLWLGQVDAGAALAEEASRRLGEMRDGLPGVQALYVQAAVQILRGKLEPGMDVLLQALTAQGNVSLRNFQIVRTSEMYDSRVITPRIAVDLYGSLLADPSQLDWILQPLDTMSVLRTPHDPAFDRWFTAALERKDAALALEIAEQTKRRRFLALRPLGGRLAALRMILEAPDAQLSQDALLERQQIQSIFPMYKTLADASQTLQDQLRAGPVLPTNAAETKSLTNQYEQWQKNADQRQLLLAQLAVRRLSSSLEFPPQVAAKTLQASLGESEALVIFHSVGSSLFGFLVTNKEAHIWQLRDPRRLRTEVGELLRAMGNFGPNRQLSLTELGSDKWRKAAADVFTSVFTNARLDVAKTASLVIVPDDVLWHLPFEVLVPDAANTETLLADRVLIRYGPTAALAISRGSPLRRVQRTGIVANETRSDDSAAPNDDELQELDQVVAGPLRLPSPLPEQPRLIAPLLDQLINFDEVAFKPGAAGGAAALPKTRGSADDGVSGWFGLPYGRPERIVLSGIATAAEQGLKGSRRGGTAAARAGDEMFQAMCSLMEGGARTILVTRWRTGGRTNFDLVREFAGELADSPPSEAWQRACLLAREAPLDATREPRLKRSDETGEAPTADHPFFWAGYMLVDNSPPAVALEGEMPVEGDAEPNGEPADEKDDSEATTKNGEEPATPPPASAAPTPKDNQRR